MPQLSRLARESTVPSVPLRCERVLAADAACVNGLNLFQSFVGNVSAHEDLDNFVDACPLVQFNVSTAMGIVGPRAQDLARNHFGLADVNEPDYQVLY